MDERNRRWTPPSVDPAKLRLGDMPGDRIRIDDSHIRRAEEAFSVVLPRLEAKGDERLVLSVYGGSGVGKSEIGSILAYFCGAAGYPAYVMSGDNYPHRCPPQNDAERLNVYRAAGLSALARDEAFSDDWDRDIHAAWDSLGDADPALARSHRGFAIYQEAGRAALQNYLGTRREIDFDLVNAIVARFRSGAASIPLKRMGRTPRDIHFETVDFSGIRVLIIEWTHGNNPRLEGVDLPLFLYSSPQETLDHRRSRAREADLDSSFVRLVLDIEQSRLNTQAKGAALILAKDGRILQPEDLGGRIL